MEENEVESVLGFLKALADERRLRMVGYLATSERTVSELAELLGLSEPTISHHMKTLRSAGLVNLRVDGNLRYYILRRKVLQKTLERVQSLENGISDYEPVTDDKAWIDNLDLSASDKKILREYTFGGRLRQIPRTGKRLHAILRWLASMFEAGRTYSEREVNDIIMRVNPDTAGLRRDLISFNYMQRERDGRAYWLADPPPNHP